MWWIVWESVITVMVELCKSGTSCNNNNCRHSLWNCGIVVLLSRYRKCPQSTAPAAHLFWTLWHQRPGMEIGVIESAHNSLFCCSSLCSDKEISRMSGYEETANILILQPFIQAQLCVPVSCLSDKSSHYFHSGYYLLVLSMSLVS